MFVRFMMARKNGDGEERETEDEYEDEDDEDGDEISYDVGGG